MLKEVQTGILEKFLSSVEKCSGCEICVEMMLGGRRYLAAKKWLQVVLQWDEV